MPRVCLRHLLHCRLSFTVAKATAGSFRTFSCIAFALTCRPGICSLTSTREAAAYGAHNMKRRRDPMERMIESALQPGRFIDWKQGASFLQGLYEAEHEIEALVPGNPERAAYMFETLIAGCNLKANEIDDSDGVFDAFVGSILCGWIKARQAAGADADKTAETLLSSMENDDYGFCSDLKSEAAKVLDRAGLASFERVVRVRFESARLKPEERVGGYYH